MTAPITHKTIVQDLGTIDTTVKNEAFMQNVGKVAQAAATFIQGEDCPGVSPVVAAMVVLHAKAQVDTDVDVRALLKAVLKHEKHGVGEILAYEAASANRADAEYDPANEEGNLLGHRAIEGGWIATVEAQQGVVNRTIEGLIKRDDIDTRVMELFLNDAPVVVPTPEPQAQPAPRTLAQRAYDMLPTKGQALAGLTALLVAAGGVYAATHK